MRMRVFSAIALLAALVVGSAPAARAQELGSSITTAEKRLERLVGHRERLEKRLDEQGARLRRLKAQPGGVRRNYQLQSALRTSQILASKLTRLQQSIRTAQENLLTAYNRALKTASRALRKPLLRRRAVLKRKMGQRPARIVVSSRARPLDNADDLEEKADLLDDSAEKVDRELVRIRRRIAALQIRFKLRRHRRTATDTLFVEDTPRRLGRVARAGRASSSSGDAVAAAPRSPVAAQAPAAAPDTAKAPEPVTTPAADTDATGGMTFDSLAPPATGDRAYTTSVNESPGTLGGSESVTNTAPPSWSPAPDSSPDTPTLGLRSALDPAAFDELRQALTHGGRGGGLTKLRTTEARLQQLTRRLAAQAKTLRQQARQRRTTPER